MVAIERVGVVGGGTMGSGIAEVCARAGMDTLVIEADGAAVDAARGRIDASLDRGVAKEKLTAEAREMAGEQLQYTIDVEAAADRDLVIEAIVESLDEKLTIFRALDRTTKPETILASNTSSIAITTLAAVTDRPDQVLGMHFFNPATVQRLVELVRGVQTSTATLDAVAGFAQDQLAKHVITCRDRAGFVVNRLLVPYLLAAIAMLDEDAVTAEDIDAGMRYGCGHPMGPLALCDLIGLDTIKSVADILYEEFKDPHYAPPPLLLRMVSAGSLGRKTGKGFYDYR